MDGFHPFGRTYWHKSATKNQRKNEAVKIHAETAYREFLSECLATKYFIPRTEASLCLRQCQT
jgi:hypothetical protein